MQRWSHELFRLFCTSKLTTSTSLLPFITYPSECSIFLWPGSKASYNTMGQPWHLRRSGLAFLHTLIVNTVAKPNGKFRSVVVNRWVILIDLSTGYWQHNSMTHCPITERSSREHWAAFRNWSPGVLWYNTKPRQPRLPTLSRIIQRSSTKLKKSLPPTRRQRPQTASPM